MAKPALDALDWDSAPVFGGLEEKSPDQIDRTARLGAELAVLPAKPPPQPTDQLILIREAVKILDVTRTQVDHWVKDGTLVERGKSEKGLKQLSLQEVQALAAERASRKLERKLPGLEREQVQLERAQVNATGFSRTSSSHRDEERRHAEMIDALQEIRHSQEASAREQMALMRVLAQEQRETNEQLQALNTALAVAGGGAALMALLPDHLVREIKSKVGGGIMGLIRPEAEPTTSLISENGAGGRQLSEAGSPTIIEDLQRKLEAEKNRTK